MSLAHKCPEGGKQEGARGEFRLSVPLNAGCCRLVEVGDKRPGRAPDQARGKIRGFTGSSRRRLLEKANSINRAKIADTFFGAMTVPAGELDWQGIERCRRAWVKRLRRRWGQGGWFLDWKKEAQENGTPHLHFLLYWRKDRGQRVPRLNRFRAWNDRAWAQVVKSEHPAHERVGCRVEKMRSWQGVAFYCAKYLCKSQDGLQEETGRIWGRVNADQAPEDWQREILSADVGKRVRRALRKLQQRKRERYLVHQDGRWQVVRKARAQADPTRWESPAQRAGRLAQLGLRVKRIRPRVLHTREVPIWADVLESTAHGKTARTVEKLGTEKHSFCSSLHFLASGEALRLVEFTRRPPAGGLAAFLARWSGGPAGGGSLTSGETVIRPGGASAPPSSCAPPRPAGAASGVPDQDPAGAIPAPAFE